MEIPLLTDVEARVLGSLVEKELTTPEYYPLSLNALVNACNQINNRDPVVAYGEGDVSRALDSLRDKRLAVVITGGTSRVQKFGHKFADVFTLSRAEVAALAVLLLRGPQTVGEIRNRSGRLHEFADLSEAQTTLATLAERAPPLVTCLPRQPGTKESRYAHLLCGEVPSPAVATAAQPANHAPSAAASTPAAATANLEIEVAELRKELAELREQFAEFRRQFD
ncbi:MAG: YceH family protein [Candidatus Didemnitutus sp.]|nr:YceH family protein [Candidatus Didemnitutus sp.]